MTANNELRKRIAEANEAYWSLGVSLMPDEEYDRLKEALHMEESFIKDAVKFGTPAVNSEGKILHTRPMLSMQKVYDEKKLLKWIATFPEESVFIIMPKYDGVALALYPNMKVATRGDGLVGEDVTNAATFVNEEWWRTSTVYGEAVVPLKSFEKIKDKYKTPRNAISGILNADDKEIQQLAKYAEFIPYSNFVVYVSRKTLLIERGKVDNIIKGMEPYLQVYPCDGIVFRVADDALFEKLGHTDHHWRGQIALKFANKSAETILERIDWQVKNGTVTPVGILKPVELDGVTVSRVTLHNVAKIQGFDIRPGDLVRIERAGGVVPKFIINTYTRFSAPERTKTPTHCPVCQGVLCYEGARLFCSQCEGRP
jgi:DNA ligase (NAD+)